MTDVTDFSQYKLGEKSDTLFISSRKENHDAAQCMIEQGIRTLHWFTHNLDRNLYDTSEFIQAVKQLAIGSPHSKVYILVKDSSDIVAKGHRIVELARRISSHVFIHRADEEDMDRLDSFLIVDEKGLIRRPHGERFEARVDFHNPGDSRILLKYFNDAWERSHPDPELRRLHI
jgi:hypothetical protein